jgi:hypothetical protein
MVSPFKVAREAAMDSTASAKKYLDEVGGGANKGRGLRACQ